MRTETLDTKGAALLAQELLELPKPWTDHTVINHIHAGRLRAHRGGHGPRARWVVRRADVEELVAAIRRAGGVHRHD